MDLKGLGEVGKDEVLEVLRHVYDPDYIDTSVVDLGLINGEDIKIAGDSIEVAYKVTAPLCPFSVAIGVMIKYALEKKFGVHARVKMKSGHLQENLVSRILTDEGKQKELLKKLESYGILEQCVRI